ncbi:protein of unknown function [Taphrina deformans PYCC 5710]|uniref:60S ribosomal protein L14 n=1 Tax=Taphrina deformans (strain PYCC 5710 / ATCC 11124 / CBS 356.35 / IMI 108563 / JCM 9778 / NBRC 8474) TaxID=1097556 RepID=R4XH75_TAPDE|nr:protein of unknown function [Taphrina deformans PYCC 5710]|eukprot:CCG85043.1 protein of unknown function [Taphrina deformans PYCC 5710]
MSFAPSTQNEGLKRFVQIGRVVYLSVGPYAGKLAVIAQIVEHNRALIDGPSTGVARHVQSYSNHILTPYVVPGLPRSTGSTALSKCWKKSGVKARFEIVGIHSRHGEKVG